MGLGVDVGSSPVVEDSWDSALGLKDLGSVVKTTNKTLYGAGSPTSRRLVFSLYCLCLDCCVCSDSIVFVQSDLHRLMQSQCDFSWKGNLEGICCVSLPPMPRHSHGKASTNLILVVVYINRFFNPVYKFLTTKCSYHEL